MADFREVLKKVSKTFQPSNDYERWLAMLFPPAGGTMGIGKWLESIKYQPSTVKTETDEDIYGVQFNKP